MQGVQPAGGGDAGEGMGAGLGVSGEVVVPVDGDEAERGPVAFAPLEVVEGRPVQVAAHVGPFGPRLGDRDEVGVQVVDAFGVGGGGDAVLGDVQRQPVRAAWCSIWRRPSGWTAQPIWVVATSGAGVPNQVGEAGSTHCLR